MLIPLGGTLGVLDARQASILTAIAAITMLLGPPVATLTDGLLRRLAEAELREPEDFSDASGSVLVIVDAFGKHALGHDLAEPAKTGYDHRQRPRNDGQRGRLRLQGLLR